MKTILLLTTVGLMLVMPAVSMGATATVGSSTASSTSTAGVCSRTLVSLVNALTAIDGRMDVGVTYNQFQELLSRAHVAYTRIVVRTESSECVKNVGIPAERALNAYSELYDSWSQCLDWYNSAETQNRVNFGFKTATCENGPGHGYETRQRLLDTAHLNTRRATNALG
jgi:hypothetical protein